MACIRILYFFIFLIGFLPSWVWGSAPLIRQLLSENRAEEAVPICRQYEVLPSRDNDVFLACAWVYYRTFRATAADALIAKLKTSKTLPEYQLLEIYASVAREFVAPETLKTLDSVAKQQYDEKIKNRLQEAQKRLEPLISEQKTTAVGKLAQELSAEFYEMKGQLEPAAFLYRGLISDNPKSARATWGLGRYYLARGDTRRAKIYLEKTAELWPRHLGSRYNLGLIYINEGPESYKQAAKWLAEAFKLNNADAGVLEQIGILLESKNKAEAAIKYWQRAVELSPQATIASKKLEEHFDIIIEKYIAQKKWKEALAKLDQVTKVKGELSRYSVSRGIIYRNMGDFEKASVALKGAVQSDPENPIAVRELGISELNLKHYDEAVNLFDKLTNLEKTEAMNYAWLGFALEAKKEYVKASQAWNKAATLFKEPNEIKKALEKVVRLEQKVGDRGIATQPEMKQLSNPLQQGE